MKNLRITPYRKAKTTKKYFEEGKEESKIF